MDTSVSPIKYGYYHSITATPGILSTSRYTVYLWIISIPPFFRNLLGIINTLTLLYGFRIRFMINDFRTLERVPNGGVHYEYR